MQKYIYIFLYSSFLFYLYCSFRNFANYSFGSNKQIKIKGDIHAKVFKKWEHDFPCYVEHSKTSDKARGEDLRGLVYIKSPKCASTTLSGISLRIAHRHTTEEGSICATTSQHDRAAYKKVAKRIKDKTFVSNFYSIDQTFITNRFNSLEIALDVCSKANITVYKSFFPCYG